MAIKRHISHLKSSGSTSPAYNQLLFGEIAVGYGKGHEVLYIRNSDNEVIPFANAADSSAEAQLYTDNRVITKVTGDTEVSLSLSAINPTGRTLTVTHASGSAQSGFKKLSSDSYGHITGASDVTTQDLIDKGALSGVTGENGISASTKSSGNQKIGHTNSITAGTAKTSSSTVVATPTGNNITIPNIAYDKHGHVTSTTTDNVTLKVNSATTSTEGVVYLATTTGSNNTNTVMTQSAVTKAIEDSFAKQDAMVYKGLVGSGTNYGFPTTFSKGATYKVATAFTVNNVKYEIGDMFIANTDVTSAENFNQAHWDAIQTNLDPTLYVNTATTVTGTDGLGGGGNLSANRTITHNTNGSLGAGTTSPSTTQTPSFGSTFNVPVVSYDKYGHITASTTTTVTIPSSASSWTNNYYITGASTTTAASKFSVALNGNNSAAKASFDIPSATTSAAGVMTSTDKTKLNNMSVSSATVTQTNTSGDEIGTITINGSGVKLYADNQTLTIKGGSNNTNAVVYNESAAKTLTVSGAADSGISVNGGTNTLTIDLGDIVCGDYA